MALPEQRAAERHVHDPVEHIRSTASNPSTYPERLTIQAPTDQTITMTQTAVHRLPAGQVARLGPRHASTWACATTSTSRRSTRPNNPAFTDPNAYPVDKNNLSPRVGFTYTMDEGQSLIRTGWGLFYDKTNFGQLNSYVTSGRHACRR